MNKYRLSARSSRELLSVIWDRYDNTDKQDKADRVLQYLYKRKARDIVVKRYTSNAYADVMYL